MADPNNPPPNANSTARWPSVRGPPVTRTPNLFENTSLAPPPSPPFDLTPSQRRRADAAVARSRQHRQQAREEAQGHATEAAYREKQRLDAAKADQAWAALQAYQVGLEPHTRAFANAFAAWKAQIARGDGDAEMFGLFEKLVKNAGRASAAETRRWDIISWFNFDSRTGRNDDEVMAMDDAVERVAAYCFYEAKFKQKHHMAEYTANRTDHDDCGLDEACRSDFSFAVESEVRFGYERKEVENEYHDFGFRNYTHIITTPADLKHLKANFEVRKLRLAHADRKDRFGHGNIDDEGWILSLDGQMVEFISQATEMASPNTIQEAIMDELDALSSIADTRTYANAQTAVLTLDFGPLWRDMTTYQTDLMVRKRTIEEESSKLRNIKALWERCKQNNKLLPFRESLEAAIVGVRLRAAMAEGVCHCDPDGLDVEGEMMEEVAGALVGVGW